MRYSAWFQCSEGCDDRHELTDVLYECPRCGGLLEVAHSVEALRNRSAAAWMSLFDQRYMTTEFPYGSGVWGKKEWVYPHVSNENIVSMYEGGTNLFRAERLGEIVGLDDLWIKQSGNSHSGSFKDLGITVLVSAVKETMSRGRDVAAVICASTGDTSASVSAYCAAAGIPVGCAAAPGQGIHRPADPAAGERRNHPRPRHGLRRLHGPREAAERGPQVLPGELGQPPADRGAEDREHRDNPAGRLGGARLGDRARR